MYDDLKRRENESDFEHYQRIGLAKLSKEIDLEWDELAEMGDIGESGTHYRKKMYGVKEATDYYEEKIEKLTEEFYQELHKVRGEVDREIEDKRLKEINNKVLQLEKEKLKLKDQRNDLNAIKRTIARTEHLVECMKDYIQELNEIKPLIATEYIGTNMEKDGIILLSDLHIGAYCENMLDQYNPEICKDKLNYYINKSIEKIRRDDINKVYFLVAGDILSGIIHNTTRFSNRLNISEQVLFAGELLAEAINKVSQYANVEVGILSGNHDRVTPEKNEHIEDENFVVFVKEMVRLRLTNNEKVVMLEPQDTTLLSLDIRGYKIAVVHGNHDRRRTIDRLIEMNKEVYDYILMGHFHKLGIESHNHTEVICNGSFAGEEYAKNARLYNKPQQLFMTITDDGIDDICPINLNNYKK